MPSVDVNLDLPDLLNRAIMQNSVEWVICDLLVTLRKLRIDSDTYKWSNHLFMRSLSWDQQVAVRNSVIENLEECLRILDPDTKLIEVSKVAR